MHGTVLFAYVTAGLVLPMFNVPQIIACVYDRDGLQAYSLTKAAGQIACRLAMLPFIVEVGSLVMTLIVSCDLAARVFELGGALRSLRLTGWSWKRIARRLLSIDIGAARRPLLPIVEEVHK